MADITDETLRRLNASLSELTDVLTSSTGAVINRTDAEERSTESTLEIDKIRAKAAKDELDARAAQSRGLQSGKQALVEFHGALTDSSNSLKKYSSGINSALGSISSLVGPLGTFGKVLQAGIQGVQYFTDKVLTQADNIVKAYDEIATLGGAVHLTSEDIAKLGKNAGFSTHVLATFTKNAKDAGMNLIALGGSTSQGLDAFSKFTNVGDKQLQVYRRLGISQDALIEMQTTYMKQQVASGRLLRESPEQLQKASLAYIDNLNVLAELTGIDIKKQQEALDVANANENFNAYKFAQEQKIAELRDKGLHAEADQVAAVLKAKDEFATMAVATMSASNAAAALESISTNNATVLTESNVKLVQAGIPIMKMTENLNKGVNQTSELIGAQAKAADDFTKTFGEAGYAFGKSSRELQEIYGIDNKTRLTATQFEQLKTEEGRKAFLEERRLAKEALDAKKAGAGPEDQPMAMKAGIESVERFARQLEDTIVAGISPFRDTTIAATAASLALVTALGAATLALEGFGRSAGRGGGAGAPPGGGGGKFSMGKLAAGAGLAGAAAIGGNLAADALGRDTTAGTAVGVLSAGASGAALGSMFGPLGALAGGALGLAYGGYQAYQSRQTDDLTSKRSSASASGLLELIARLESANNPNILYGGRSKTDPPLTDMTIGEVMAFQSQIRGAGAASTAAGKYQIIGSTLQQLVSDGVVTVNEKFSSATQDRLALALLEKRGFSKFKSGQITPNAFANNVAQEWAALPMPNNKSYYDKDGLNKSLVSREEYMRTIQARDGGIASGPGTGYPATLHGNEMIQPLDPNSILEKLATTPLSAESSAMMAAVSGSGGIGSEDMRNVVSMQTNLIDMLSAKLDGLMDRIEAGNNIQDKILKYSAV